MTRIKTTLLVIFAALLLSITGVSLASAASPDSAPGTAWGCVTGSTRSLEHVYTIQSNFDKFLAANGGQCPGAGSWVAVIGANISPSPAPSTSTSSAPAPPPSSSAAEWCGSNSAFMQFGNLALYGGEWNSSLPQEICGTSGSSWDVTFNAPNGNTDILTYPDVQLNYGTDPPLVSGLSSNDTSSWNETMNANAGTSAEAAFDIWLNIPGTSNRQEVMIWTDTVNRGTVGGATEVGSATVCGQSWQLWRNGSDPGSELIWYTPTNEKSGTACTADMLQVLQTNGYLSTGATLSQYEYGWEIASTGGQSEKFVMNSFSVSGFPAHN
jgi:hypothetical protein